MCGALRLREEDETSPGSVGASPAARLGRGVGGGAAGSGLGFSGSVGLICTCRNKPDRTSRLIVFHQPVLEFGWASILARRVCEINDAKIYDDASLMQLSGAKSGLGCV
jgi:hypothetical protein